MFLKVANQWKQHGFAAALSTIGWLVLILGEGICYWLSTKGYAMDVPMYVVGAVAGLLIFVFNNVRRMYSLISVPVYGILIIWSPAF